MKKYAKVVNEQTKACDVGVGTNVEFYKSIGMTEQEVEQSYNGQWYLKGYAPQKTSEMLIEEHESQINKLNVNMLRDVLIIVDDEQTAEKKEEAKRYLAQKKIQKNNLIEKINELRRK